MRNLFVLFWKYHLFLLFLLLEGIAFLLIVQGNKHHSGQFYSSANAVAGNRNSLVNNDSEYFDLKQENQELVREVAELKSLEPNAFRVVSASEIEINDTVYQQQYKFLGAKVIKSTVNRRNNYLMLNRGTSDGLAPDMGVIGPNGVVGKVQDVSEHFATVTSVLHKHTSIPTLHPSSGFPGLLNWDGADPTVGILNDVPLQAKVAEGDTLVTSGSSTIFPEGVAIGTVIDFEPKPESNFHRIRVRLFTNFYTVSHCFVVKNLLKSEQLELENQMVQDE
ncbi:MAG: rod shape-determining protein MreC [Salibacteraceae bacterium]